MTRFLRFFALSALFVSAGCQTIRRANEEQEIVRTRLAEEHALPEESIDFSGAEFTDFLKCAFDHRPSLLDAKYAVDDARLRMKEIDANAPIFSSKPWTALDASVSGGYSASSGAATFSDQKWKLNGSGSAGLSLDLLVYDFGRHAAQARAQTQRILATEGDLIKEMHTIFGEVAQAYYGRLEADAQLIAAETNVVTCLEQLRQTQRRFQLGEARELDCKRSEFDLEQAKEQLVTSSNAVMTASVELCRAIGVAPESAALLSLGESFFPMSMGSAEELLGTALTNAPSIRVARASLRAADADVSAAIAELYPTITASATLSWTDPLWVFRSGLNAVQSLFTGFRKTTAVDRAVVAMQRASARLTIAEQTLTAQLAKAVAERDTARESISASHVSLQAAEENLRLVTRANRLGEASEIEYSIARNDYVRAQATYIKALYRAQVAEARILELIGAD